MNRRSRSIVLFAALSLLVAGALRCGEPSNPEDTTPPAAVDSLTVASVTHSSVTLAWTAPGDDGASGKASSYDARYSVSSITGANWDSASQASGETSPKTAGSAETFTVTGLSAATEYFLALKTTDDAGNESGLSNVVVCTTAVAPGSPDLDGYWMIRLESDEASDLGDRGDCVEMTVSGSSVGMTSGCFDGSATGTFDGDSLHLETTDGLVTLHARVFEDSMRGRWSSDDPDDEGPGTWTATRMAAAPDEKDCAAANADVVGGHCADGRYFIVAQIDDHDGLVASATISGDGITGSVALTDTLYPEETDEWWTDLCAEELTLAQGSEPSLPLSYTIHIEWAGGGSRDVPFTVGRFVESDCPDFNCGCGPLFFDDFESMTLNPKLTVHDGDATVYSLNGDDLVMDDSETYTDGPLFVYADSIVADHTRLRIRMRTEAMNGEVQLALVMRGSDEGAYVFGLWEGLRIERDAGTVTELAYDAGFAMGDHETLWFVCDYDAGTLTFTVKEDDGSSIASLSATDPSPLPPGRVLFGGEIDGTTGESLYFERVHIEECE